MIKKLAYTFGFMLLVVFATEHGRKTPASGAVEAKSVTSSNAVSEIDSPAGPGSREPNLSVGPDGRVYLSWLEPVQPNGYALKFAVRSKGGDWSTPRTITQRDNWFMSSSIVALPDGSLAAHWISRSGPGRHAEDVNVSVSRDAGRTWSKAIVPHRDGTQTEHGFVSMIPATGGIATVWLDGRKMAGAEQSAAGPGAAKKNRDHNSSQHPRGDHGAAGHTAGSAGHGPSAAAPVSSAAEMSLMYTMIGLDGTLGKEVVLDGRACECCHTSAAPTPGGMAVVYRDRTEKEVRDISIVRLENGKWTEPQPVSNDGWEINGCPVNGPAISSAGKNLAVAWFTAANDQPRVCAAFSADGGATFGPKILVDDENAIGRVDVIALPSGNALVSWVERTPSGAEIRARIVRRDRSKAPSIIIAETRSSSFPRMKMSGDEVVIAWTDARTPSKVRTAVLEMAGN